MSRSVKDPLAEVLLDVGVAVAKPLVEALFTGDPEKAARNARIVAETRAGKIALRAARGKARR